jgi:hypothetical protein
MARVTLVVIGVGLGTFIGQAIGQEAGQIVAWAYAWLDRGFGLPRHGSVVEFLDVSLAVLGTMLGAAVGGLLGYQDPPAAALGAAADTEAPASPAIRRLAAPSAPAGGSRDFSRAAGAVARTALFGLVIGGMIGLAAGYAAALLYFSLALFGLPTDGFVGMAMTLWATVVGLLVGVAGGAYEGARQPVGQ